MASNRRRFLTLAAGSALIHAVPGPALASTAHARFRAIAFDGFPIFDPRPVAALAESLLPGHGAALMNAWRVRQFDYQWLRALGGRYADFLQVTRDSLDFALVQQKLTLTPDERERLIAAWTTLPVWPDVPEALSALRAAGLRLAMLSNMTEAMLVDGLQRAGVSGQIEAVISTDRIRSYKPHPDAYRLGIETLGLEVEEVLFVAFAGWDVAGAKWFGYPTFWLDRLGAPPERLGAQADASGADMQALLRFVQAPAGHGRTHA